MREKASTAAPLLSNIVVSTPITSYALSFAIGDLQEIGPTGRAVLVTIIQNTNLAPSIRTACLRTIAGEYRAYHGGPHVKELREPLVQSLGDANPTFRSKTKAILQMYAPELLINNVTN